MADASDSKSDGGNLVRVQVPPPAPQKRKTPSGISRTVSFFIVRHGRPSKLSLRRFHDTLFFLCFFGGIRHFAKSVANDYDSALIHFRRDVAVYIHRRAEC